MSPSTEPAHPFSQQARRHHRGILAIKSHHGTFVEPVRFIIESRTGKLVLPTRHDLTDTDSLAVYLPEERPDALQFLADAEQVPDWRSSEPCDRWQAYHGRPDAGAWYTLTASTGRLEGGRGLIEDPGPELVNRLAAVEFALIKLANADRAAVARLAQRRAAITSPDAICVGIDQLGLDIRGPVGIIRVEFDHPCLDRDSAERALRSALVD